MELVGLKDLCEMSLPCWLTSSCGGIQQVLRLPCIPVKVKVPLSSYILLHKIFSA